MPTKPQTHTNDAKQHLEEAYDEAEKATLETVDNIKNSAQEKFEACSEDVQKATKQATKKAENVIKERPLLSIGCAFLAGWAVSKLIK